MNSELISKIVLMITIPFVFVALITPYIGKLALQIGAVDIPRTRHIHSKTTPKLGGLGIFLGYLLGYMIFGTHSAQMNSILIASFIIILTGIVDDIVELKPGVKFGGQLISALIIPLYGNILLKDVSAFGIYLEFGILSIPLNIAEGYGRQSKEEFRRFLRISLGSSNEVEAILEISKELKYINEEEYQKLSKENEEIGKMIYRTIEKWK